MKGQKFIFKFLTIALTYLPEASNIRSPLLYPSQGPQNTCTAPSQISGYGARQTLKIQSIELQRSTQQIQLPQQPQVLSLNSQ
jgi:hypothetical protein